VIEKPFDPSTAYTLQFVGKNSAQVDARLPLSALYTRRATQLREVHQNGQS
jgi:hypothetical protein